MDDFVLVEDIGPFKPPPASTSTSASASHYDDMFDSYFNRSAEPPEPSPSSPPPGQLPVFDKPVFDDDPDVVNPFGAIPLFGDGGDGGGEGEDYLDPLGKATKLEREPESVGFDDDLIAGLGGSTRSTTPVKEVEQEPEAEGFNDDRIPEFGVSTKPMKAAPQAEPEAVVFDDDVIPGFIESTCHHDSTREESRTRQEKESISSSKTSVSMPDDPFVMLGATSNLGYSPFGLFTDHLDSLGMLTKSESTKFDAPSPTSGMFYSSDNFGGVPKTIPSFSFASANESDVGENRLLDDINNMSHSNLMPQGNPVQRASAEALGSILPEMHFTESSNIHEAPGTTGFHTGLLARNMREQLLEENQYSKMPNDVWLTVSDIVLVTQPTRAPPPSRPPPPLATKQPPAETYPDHHNPGYHPSIGSANTSKTSQIDELEDFVITKPAKFANGHSHILNHKGIGQDCAEGRRPKGVNKEEFDSMFTSSQCQQEEINEKAEFYAYEMERDEERLEHERKQREKEEEQKRLEREREEDLEREREKARRREQEERKRREKEKEGRQAVEKAIREARERAAAEARMQAEKEVRQRAERAAVQKVAEEARARAAVEARERAAKVAAEAKERAALEARERAAAEAKERAALEARERAAAEAKERMAKATAEARERAAAEARERAARADAETREKAVAESQAKAAAEARAKAERAAVEKAAAEARRRAERAAVERATAEARQRAANDARERAATEARARENQQRTAQPDLDSFFGMPSRSGSVPRSQATTTNPFDVQPQGSADFGAVRRTSSGSASPFTQPPSCNLMDDLSSIFGAPSSSAVFQEVDGESEERRKARLERHQRTMERAAKAVAEKNERDLQVQWEQEERHRIGETLDFEIKRWAAGKEGNLRALLSTLQYVLWPECRWNPISLTDLITAASVKKVYRKATLCIHPDKVQQKGANLQQKYIAEKVFDLLKEAWNKFNSEEFF